MIKKILGIFILLIIIIFLALYVAVDKILIKNTITNIEKKLNLNIKNSNQVNVNDTLVEFYTNSNEIWHHYKVYKTDETGITLECPSKALLFVSNYRLNYWKEFFKRV